LPIFNISKYFKYTWDKEFLNLSYLTFL
jgi:hypothetical protein